METNEEMATAVGNLIMERQAMRWMYTRSIIGGSSNDPVVGIRASRIDAGLAKGLSIDEAVDVAMSLGNPE